MPTNLFLLQAAVGVQDSAAALPSAHFEGVDSVVVDSPLPGGVAEVVRFLLGVVPWWLQLAGIAIGAIVGLVVVGLAVRHRAAILGWLGSRARGVQVGLALGVLAVIGLAGTLGAKSWDYVQHDNGFCTGCHVMEPAFKEFVDFPDKHDSLACHDCHTQSTYASLRQLYLWIAERPDEIRPHSKVANEVCETCHVVEGDTAVWQRIAATAGHRVHFESDSSALKDLQCVTCHGVEVHRFVPAPATCGQEGCHEESSTKLVLGKMAEQTVQHCTTCHRFTAEVPALATTDSARGTLVPANTQCLGCHEMQALRADFDVALDPHGGTCGTCHNPHKQEQPEAALITCASAGCHDNWRDEPFHIGREHRRDAAQCETCHLPHQSKVDASDCENCHRAVRARDGRRPPIPFDTTEALRRSPPPPDPGPDEEPRGKGDRPPEASPSGGLAWVRSRHAPAAQAPVRAAQDSFPHQRHRTLACLECHTTREGHGGLTFVAPRGCNICHHQAPATSKCDNCHKTGSLAQSHAMTVRVAIPDSAARPREVGFEHAKHPDLRCQECHTTPVTLAPRPQAVQCVACHEEHHGPAQTCSACHRGRDLKAVHAEPRNNHRQCDACHTRDMVARLTPTRPFCGTCHDAQRTDHYEPRQCTVCHFLTEPERLRPRLLRPQGAP